MPPHKAPSSKKYEVIAKELADDTVIESGNSFEKYLQNGFRNVVKGHRALHLDGQILYRDVSRDNMRSITPGKGAAKGL
jgi:hypothetical protein